MPGFFDIRTLGLGGPVTERLSKIDPDNTLTDRFVFPSNRGRNRPRNELKGGPLDKEQGKQLLGYRDSLAEWLRRRT